MYSPKKEPEIKTFEETLLTEEEQAERKKESENDKALAAYYKQAFESPEAFFLMNENFEDDIPEDDCY